MEKLARKLLNHLGGILNYCRTKVAMGVMEAVNGNIKALLQRGRRFRDLTYLLLKANAWRPLRPNSSFFRKPPNTRIYPDYRSEPVF